MRKRILRAITLAVLALVLVCPQLSLARTVRIGTGTSVTCGTTPTKLDDTSVPDSVARTVMARIESGTGVVYIGFHDPANGKPLTAGKGMTLFDKERWYSNGKIDADLAYYCITASGTVPVRVLEEA